MRQLKKIGRKIVRGLKNQEGILRGTRGHFKDLRFTL